MHRRLSRQVAALLALIGASCSPKLDIPQGAQLTCASSSECPSNLICHSGYCVDASKVDTVPPDLAAQPIVSPAVGTAGATFTVSITSTKDLAQPPTLELGLDVPVAVPCAPVSGRTYTCSYTATGAENAGAGGTVSFDVKLLDTSFNEATKRLAGVLRLDFRPPDVLPLSASLVLVPAPGNPLRTLGAAGSGATIQVAFTVDEVLSLDPVVVGSGPGTSLAFSKVSAAGESYLYEYVLSDPSPGQGPYALEATLTDVAGNAATRTLALPGNGLVVDTVPPAAPATTTPSVVVYRRVPWGSAASGGQAQFDVYGRTGAVEASAVVQIFDGPDPASAAELGRGQAAPDGSFPPVAVGRADHPVVWAAAVDAAGNRSPLADVKDVRWVATLGGKVPGSTMENPTTLVETGWSQPVAAQTWGIAVEPDQTSLAGLALPDTASVTKVAEQRWLQRNAAGSAPLRRYKHTMAYDSDRGKMLVFGGYATDTGRDQSDLWEWDGTTGVWTDRTPPGLSPGPTQAAVLAYDERRARAVMFVGEDDSTGGTGTWEWDPATSYWLDRSPPGGSPSPPGRDFFMMAYDAGRARVVLFGGTATTSPYGGLNDTWEWDGATGAWTQRLPNGDLGSPPARYDAAMAYDSTRGKVVLWGGYGGAGTNDTWEWDGNAGTWTHVTAATGPLSDGEKRMAYDPLRQKMVLWGGSSWTTGQKVWEYDATATVPSWADRTPLAGALPCGVEDTGLAYDVARARTVLFGGVGSCGANTYTNQVWDWTGNVFAAPGTWTNRTASGASVPSGRKDHAMAYDANRRKVVLYGGATDGGVAGSSFTPLSDTWEMDPDTGNWTEVLVTSAPGARTYSAMAYDATRKTVILFGGTKFTPPSSSNFDAETWEWNGTVWAKRTPATSPSARAYQALVTYVRGGVNKILMVGGAGAIVPTDTTWEWDGAANAGAGNWTNLTPGTGPSARGNPGLAWDGDRGLVAMYGGYDYGATSAPYQKNDLWTWNGAAWSKATVASAPPLRTNPFGFVYDASRRKLFLWGGMDPSTYNALPDSWEWDATAGTWASRTPSIGAIPARESFAAYWDPVRQMPTMFGGGGNFWEAMKQDAWEWQPGVQARSAFVWSVPWSASGEKGATFLGVDATASAAGMASDPSYPANPSPGAALLGWDHLGGSWRFLAQNAAGVTPGSFTYSTVDPTSVARILPGPALSAFVAVVPAAFNQKGTTLSEATLDYVEFAVTYRRTP